MKYPDQPDKFADSKIELHDEIERLKILAGGPELYPDLVALNTVPSIIGLLGHDNTDIAVDVVGLLVDLTDEDVLEDNDEPAASSSRPSSRITPSSSLSRISAASPRPTPTKPPPSITPSPPSSAGRVKVREFDANKLYASEILAIPTANQKKLGQTNGVDAMLQAVAMYKSKDPKSTDEEEMLGNLFDCLCCLLMQMENEERFLKLEGVELMIIIMKQKKSAYGSAIRVLDFAIASGLWMCWA